MTTRRPPAPISSRSCARPNRPTVRQPAGRIAGTPMPTMIDLHDPGASVAGDRAADVEAAATVPIEASGGGRIRVGTASWTDPTMTATGVFYPASATTAEERLQHYAATFPLVEVDATYYALPAEST